MPVWEKYILPASLQEALEAIASAPGTARFIAGGTDLLLDLQQGKHPPVHTLVDITELPETTALEIRSGELFIGAAVPLNRIVHSPLVMQHAQALAEASALIGGPQVRNTASLGGNVCHALPAADGAIALLALDADAEIADRRGCRRAPLGELFLGPGRSALHPRAELLTGFYLPLSSSGQASAHRRVMRPQGVAIAILNMAIWLARRDDLIQDIRIAVGPAGTKPLRAVQTENFLRGKPYRPETVAQSLEVLLAETHFRTSPHRATAEYRRHLAGVLLEDALQAAWRRAGESGGRQENTDI